MQTDHFTQIIQLQWVKAQQCRRYTKGNTSALQKKMSSKYFANIVGMKIYGGDAYRIRD